jgi:hypothetical protein
VGYWWALSVLSVLFSHISEAGVTVLSVPANDPLFSCPAGSAFVGFDYAYGKGGVYLPSDNSGYSSIYRENFVNLTMLKTVSLLSSSNINVYCADTCGNDVYYNYNPYNLPLISRTGLVDPNNPDISIGTMNVYGKTKNAGYQASSCHPGDVKVGQTQAARIGAPVYAWCINPN